MSKTLEQMLEARSKESRQRINEMSDDLIGQVRRNQGSNMSGNTMPDRIRVLMNFSSAEISPICDRLEYDGTYSAVDAESEQAMGVEYVRADLATVVGDASEPLVDGQLRWVKSTQDGKWIVGAFTNYGEGDEFFCNSDRFDGDMPVEDYFKIGPVIQPPEYE